MAKSQDLDILGSSYNRSRNSRSFCSTSMQQSAHQHSLTSPNVFLTSPEDSSFAFVLSDHPKVNANNPGVHNKSHLQALAEAQSSLSDVNSHLFYSPSEQSSRTLPHKYHPRLQLDLAQNGETECGMYSTLDSKKHHSLKSKNVKQHTDLIELGSPPSSPFRTPSTTSNTYHYGTPGIIKF